MQQQLHQYLRNMQPFFYVLGNDLLASPHQAKRNLSSHHPSFWMWSKYANVGTPWTPSGPEPSRVAIRHNNILFSHDSVMTSFSVIDQDGCVSRFQRYHSTLSSHCVKKNADWCTNAPVGSGGHDTRSSCFCFRHSLCLKDWNVKVTFFSNECLIQRTFTYQYGPSLHALSALYTPGPATPPHSTPPHPWPVELATNRGGGMFSAHIFSHHPPIGFLCKSKPRERRGLLWPNTWTDLVRTSQEFQGTPLVQRKWLLLLIRKPGHSSSGRTELVGILTREPRDFA